MALIDDLFAPPPPAPPGTVHHCSGCQRAFPLQPGTFTCPKCRSIQCGVAPVQLNDGRLVSNYSEAWKHECEALAILAIPALHRRQDQLAKVAKDRGQDAANALKATMTAIWEKGRAENNAA